MRRHGAGEIKVSKPRILLIFHDRKCSRTARHGGSLFGISRVESAELLVDFAIGRDGAMDGNKRLGGVIGEAG